MVPIIFKCPAFGLCPREEMLTMANFPTHIAIGTVVSGALATVTVAADMVAPENIVAVTLAGVLGSVLPDIDLKDSRPARAMFAGLGVFSLSRCCSVWSANTRSQKCSSFGSARFCSCATSPRRSFSASAITVEFGTPYWR